MNILICEEESVIAEIISNLLYKQGHIIYIASNSYEAIDSLKNKKIDLLITDFNLAIEQKDYFVHSARKLNPDLKIIILSSLYTEYEKMRIAQLKANHVISKPFTKLQIESALNKLRTSAA